MSKQVVFVTPNLTNGGAERVTAVLANALADEHYDVSVVMMKDDRMVYPLSEKIKVNKCFGNGGKIKRIIGKILALRKIIKSDPTDVYIAMISYESLYLHLAGLGLNIKKIYSMRNDPSRLNSAVDKIVKKYVYPQGDKIVFQTPDAMAYFPENVRRKGVIIANPLDDDLPEPFSGTREKAFVTAGRLTKQKNYPLLLNAFAAFHQQYPDWRLKIFGQGELESELRAMCADLEIEEDVSFCGFSNDLPNEINRCAAFVLASDYEGISNAMLEALGSGVPCICTDCPVGGARMFINHGENGLLIPVGDQNALTDAMCYAAERPEAMAEMAEKALKIKEKLSPVNIALEWMRLL